MLQKVVSFQLRERQPDHLFAQTFARVFIAIRVELQLQPAENLRWCGRTVAMLPNQGGGAI
jgi:hypothetical protein